MLQLVQAQNAILIETLEVIKRYKKKKTTVKRKGFVRSGLSIALLAVLIGSLSWGLIQKEQVAEYWYEQASLLPFVNAEQNYQPRADMSVYNKDTDL